MAVFRVLGSNESGTSNSANVVSYKNVKPGYKVSPRWTVGGVVRGPVKRVKAIRVLSDNRIELKFSDGTFVNVHEDAMTLVYF